MTYVIACLLAAVEPQPAEPIDVPSAGYPIARQHEHDLLKNLGSAQAHTRGTWDVGQGPMLKKAASHGANYWLTNLPKEDWRDGALRAVFAFEGKRRPAVALMFRARLNGDAPEQVSGYGVRINREGVGLQRWDDGLLRPMGVEVPLSADVACTGVEIIVITAGPLIHTLVFDRDGLKPLASLSISDTRYTHGSVGVRLPETSAHSVRLAALSFQPAGQKRAENSKAMVGRQVVRVALQHRSRLPDSLLGTVAAIEGDTLALSVRPLDLARLRRSQIPIVSATDHIPWKYVDPDYLGAKTLPPSDMRLAYKNSRMVAAVLQDVQRRYTAITKRVLIGRSAQGEDIWALKISDNPTAIEDEPSVLLDGGHHGLELLATEFVLDTIYFLVEQYPKDPNVRRWVDAFEIWCVPLVNPDGRNAFLEKSHLSGRKNQRDIDGNGEVHPREGVDLNRNYPIAWGTLGEEGSRSWAMHHRYRGPSAASEPETQAMMRLAREQNFTLALSYHTHGTVVLPPYAAKSLKSPQVDESWEVARAMVNATGLQPNRKRYRLRRRLYPVDGVWKDWLRYEIGTVAIVVEGPFHNPMDLKLRSESVERARPLWQSALRRFFEGPAISGKVRDEDDNPLTAEVRVVELQTQAGEQWHARARDGHYARYLPHAGRFRIEYSAPGYQVAMRTVSTSNWKQGVDVVLRRDKRVTQRQ